MSARRERYLAEMGISAWRLRQAGTAVSSSRTEPAHPAEPSEPAARMAPAVDAGDAWEALAAAVRACTKCALHRSRTQTVFGVGRRDARLLVIGEAPGADEDRQGEPFVGRAGQLLNAMLHAIALPRSEVYIANILKCRPPGNRDPQPDEAASCTPYLAQQIALVKPRAILAVGRIAAQWLLQSDAPIGRLRGRVFKYGEAGTPLVVTYHPAYLLRSPAEKAKAWTDLCMVRDLLSNER
ncbi:MAG TPA: uracil-DNA glycosylase [Gammaproteobacteria bacterium]|nr:uracil-DNA glycosylase [Gammaproteobacteria bacterium]